MVAETQPTHLLHLAWYTEHGSFWNQSENLAWLAASVRLVGAFAAAGGRRAVIAGSCAEYDWSAPQPCSESATPLRPHTLYGTCKKALFEVTSAHAALAGLSLAWGRIFLVHGPHEAHARFVPSLIRSMLAGQAVPMTHGLQRRDFLHAADVAEAFAALLDSAVIGPVNIGSGDPLRLIDVANHIAGRLDAARFLRVGELPARSDDPDALYPGRDPPARRGWLEAQRSRWPQDSTIPSRGGVRRTRRVREHDRRRFQVRRLWWRGCHAPLHGLPRPLPGP